MFDELDKSNPDIHEYINRIQRATGNDWYFCMLNSYNAITQRSSPTHLWRGNVKSDSPDYCFDANQLYQAKPEREVGGDIPRKKKKKKNRLKKNDGL